MTEKNCISAEFAAMSENESLARSIVSAMVLPADPTIEMMSDIRTAVSEAVTNAIVHGYPDKLGKIVLKARILEKNTM